MNIFTTITVLIIGFFLWVVWGYIKYKHRERMDKNEIYSHLHDGLALKEALKTAFSNLNKYQSLGLQDSTIDRVSTGIADLAKTMDTDNVVEIYSTFVHMYIFRNGRTKKPTNLSDQKIIYSLETLDFNERNGYFVIKPDKNEDFDKKYPG